MSQKKDQRDYKSSISLSQIVELASLGIRQSPLGLMEILPTFGPSGRQERLKRRKKVDNHFFIVSLSYTSLKAILAR